MFPAVDASKLSALAITCQTYPKIGPKMIPVLLDFSLNDGYLADLSNMQSNNQIDSVQTLYIDNSATGNSAITVTMQGTNQKIIVKANTQGYYPVLAGTVLQFTFESTASTAIIPVYMLNVPIAPFQWATA